MTINKITLYTLILLMFSGCSKNVSDEEINTTLKSALNETFFKMLAADDQQMNRNGGLGAIKVTNEAYINKSKDLDLIKYYNDLAALGVITIEKGDDMVTLNDTTYLQKHTLTAKGKQYLIEEMPSGYLLRVFDYNTFKISSKKVDGDFVIFDFAIDKIDKNELYEVLSPDAKKMVEFYHRQMGQGKKLKITPEGLKYTTDLYEGL